MIWKIAKKEFLLNLMTFKFVVGTVLCMVLVTIFMPVLINDYRSRLKQYNTDVAANEAELTKVKVYSSIAPTIYRHPNLLSVFNEGLEKRLGNSAKIESTDVYEIEKTHSDANPLLVIFPVLDISLIFEIVMSVLALLVAYDTISGEKEHGTLKLILSNNIARPKLLLGKLLAGFVTLIIPTTIAFLAGMLIIVFSPMVELTIQDWERIGLIYLTTLIFILTMFNLGLLFSCLTKRSAISLTFGLFVWLLFVSVIPNGSTWIASYIRPIELIEKFDSEVETLKSKHENDIDKLSKTLKSVRNDGSWTRGAFDRYYISICSPNFMKYKQKHNAIVEPLKIKQADQIWEVRQKYFRTLIKQKHLADIMASVSPMVLYRKLTSALSATDLQNFEHFTISVKAYKNQIVRYIRSRTKDFSLPSYFTPCKEEDWKESNEMYKHYKDAQAQNKTERIKASETFQKWQEEKIKQTPSVISQDFPHFIYKDQNLLTTIKLIIPDIVLLLFINVLLFVLSFIIFVKYDVR